MIWTPRKLLPFPRLWLPFAGGYPCCCEEAACQDCPSAGATMTVDLGAGGWTDNPLSICGDCATIGGEYDVPVVVVGTCLWNYLDETYCTGSGQFSLNLRMDQRGIMSGAQPGPADEYLWLLLVKYAGPFADFTYCFYESDPFDDPADCMADAVGGVLTLNKTDEGTAGMIYPCDVGLPATVDIWNAA